MNDDRGPSPVHVPRVDRAIPVLVVADVVRAAEFYRDRLGFSFDRAWGDPPCFVMLRRDGVEIFLRGLESGPSEPAPKAYGECEGWDVYLRVNRRRHPVRRVPT